MNEKLKTINIKGKEYVQVNDRLKAFRTAAEWAGWSLITINHELTADACTFEAQVLNKEGRVIASGWAREVRTDTQSMVNKTSYVENCETSAWGRALGNLGIGIDQAICSAQEVQFAIATEQAQKNASTPRIPSANIVTQPKQQNAPKTQENGQGDNADYLDILADIDAATSLDQLTFTMEAAKDSPYYQALRTAANNKAQANGWKR